MRRWLSEPLLHFAVAGALLFGAYAWRTDGRLDERDPDVVHVGPAEVQWLRETWQRQWQREPDSVELAGLVTEYLKEELLVREARALGLDDNDTIVRRRLAQKLEFIVQDTARLDEPAAGELEAFHAAHAEIFSEPGRVSFSQIYFGSERRADPAADAKALLSRLADPSLAARATTLGDSLMVDSGLDEVDVAAISAQFGSDFATAVLALPPGQWRGPIESAYGWHLVRVDRLSPGGLRPFGEVQSLVRERWRAVREREMGERYFASLMAKYPVRIDASIKPLVGPLEYKQAGPALADVGGQ